MHNRNYTIGELAITIISILINSLYMLQDLELYNNVLQFSNRITEIPMIQSLRINKIQTVDTSNSFNFKVSYADLLFTF